ncbi:MAG: hypothetical protein LBR36_01080 [Bacteroidales bacterium]|jgi:hypothetical protein|nr:hypothetical protein [Bacteroidales bacterium]
MKHLVISFLCCFTIIVSAQVERPLQGQELDENEEQEDQIEQLSEQISEEDADFSELIEELDFYRQNKINLNQPDYDKLSTVFQLTDYQLYHLKKYLAQFGNLYSIYELLAIEGFEQTTLQRLLPYITVKEVITTKKWTAKQAFQYGKNRLILRYGQVIEQQKGYQIDDNNPNASRYLGSPQALLLRYSFNFRDKLRFGLTAEKDAGEQFFKGSNPYGFDFYSFHLFIKDIGKLQALAVGDYHLSFGQGLALNTGFSLQKPSNSVSVERYSAGLKPYSSANEYNYMRGMAAKIDCKVLNLTLFYSIKNLDASIGGDTLDAQTQFIETLQQTGYHRTASEVANKNSIWQHLAGFHADIPFETAKIGATVYYTYFNRPLQRNLSFYNQFTFNEQDNLNASVDYKVLYKKTSFFGEFAISKNGGFATLNGINFYPHPLVTLAFLHRYYDKKYQCLNGGAFGQSSDNSAEHGFFAGANIILSKYFVLDAYVDYFQFTWLKYRIDAPTNGFEVQSKLTFTLNSRFSAYFRFKYKDKALNEGAENLNSITQTHKQTYRLHLDYKPFKWLSFKSRLEVVNYQAHQTQDYHQGYIIYQDIGFRFRRIPLTLTARFAIFDIYSYDERIYTYESDILYAFSVPAFYGKGYRVYLIGKCSITKYVDIWLKISRTIYQDRFTNGSGLGEIASNHRTDIKAEVIVKF